MYVLWITRSAYILKIETHTWERRIPGSWQILLTSQTSSSNSGSEPMPDNYSLGSLPSSRGLFFSYPECKGAWARKSPEYLVCFQILSNLEDSKKKKKSKGINYSITKSGILISSRVRMG